MAFLCKVEAIDSAAGSAEQKADWFVNDQSGPELKPTPYPFRPALTPGKQQVRARIEQHLETRFDYLFDAGRGKWSPSLGDETLMDEETNMRWTSVKGFRESEVPDLIEYAEQAGLPEISPESGSFVLFSRRRRKIGGRA